MTTTLRSLVSSGVLLAVLSSAHALTIVRTNDASMSNTAIISAADAASASAAFDYAAAQIMALYSDPVQINITLAATTDPSVLGQSNSSLIGTFTYAQIRTLLINDNNAHPSADGTTSTGALPVADPYSCSTFLVARALAKALGNIPSDTTTDGTFTFGTSFSYTYDPLNRAVPGRIDFIGVAFHEITEVMGRVARLNSTGNCNRPYDVFRFLGAGVQSLTFTDANVYFSVDGGSANLKTFNANGNGGDLGDWAGGTNDAFNAFSSTGVQNDLTPVDIRVMDVLGYDLGSTSRTLTVASTNPNSGVGVTVSPNDNNGQGSGTTQFTRVYNNNQSVSLTAPPTASGNNFQKWQRDGLDWSTSTSTTVTMNANHTMTAIYGVTPTPTPGCSPTITQSGTQTITTANSVSCNNGTSHRDNSYWRAFNMVTFVGSNQYNVTSVSFGVEQANGAGGTQPVTVRLYTNSGGAFPGGARSQIAASTVNVPDSASGTVFTVPLAATVPAGAELVMEVFTPDGVVAGNRLFIGSNADPESGPSYLSAADCGFSTPTTTAAVGFPSMHIVFNVNGSCGGGPPPSPTPCGTTVTFSNPASITINDALPASPYPSNITVSGVTNPVTKVTVTITGFNHTFPSDVDMLLVGPGGQKFILVSDVIGGTDAVGINWTFDDTAAAFIGSTGAAASGTFKPTNYTTCQDPFPAPAPAGPYLTPGGIGTPCGTDTLAAFNGVNPNGTWSLYVVDDLGADIGSISGGWSVNITTAGTGCAPSTLGNISTRLRVETGNNVLIGGFIITGTQPKRVIVRAIGPSLPFAGTLSDPVLELRNSSGGLIASNDDWRTDQEAEIIATTIPPSNDLESAIVATLSANNSAYTAIVHGFNNVTGIGVVEAYDLNQAVDSKLANISTRGLVQTGDNVMIGGLIVLGQSPLRVIVRAIGPSLSVAGALANPTLELRDGNGGLIDSNDNWRSDHEAEIIATGIPPTNDLESAIVRNLTPGNYTAIVRGVSNTTGVGLVEAYGLN